MPYGGIRRKGASSNQSARVSLPGCYLGQKELPCNSAWTRTGRSLRPVSLARQSSPAISADGIFHLTFFREFDSGVKGPTAHACLMAPELE